ncbi:MAG: peptidase M48 [Candidatus Binatia bacterium]|nr:MAG: peptidase M48 [Candidatus Binatia bacterium]
MLSSLSHVLLWLLPLVFAVVLHEVAHGAVAYRLGDPTAARAGRLTLNPWPHVDPLGTVIVPLFLVLFGAPFVFGWAKPVPVNFALLRPRRPGMVLVAAAGPFVNFCLAAVCGVLLHVLPGWIPPGLGGTAAGLVQILLLLLQAAVVVNVVLGAFNLLPILPLDGGRVLVGLLPREPARALARLEPYGMLFVVLLLATDVLDRILGPVVRTLLRLFL